MAFRGLEDFGKGFGQLADILRQADTDKRQMQTRDFQNRVAADQANALYGYQGPEVSQMQNPYYSQPAGMAVPNSPLGDRVIGAGVEPAAVEETAPLQESLPAAPSQPMPQQGRPMPQAQQGMPQPDMQGLPQGARGQAVSLIDRQLNSLMSKPTITPYEARQMQELMQMRIKALVDNSDMYEKMALAQAGVQGRLDVEKFKAQNRPKPVEKKQPLIALNDAIKTASTRNPMEDMFLTEAQKAANAQRVQSLMAAKGGYEAGVLSAEQALSQAGILPSSSQAPQARAAAPQAAKPLPARLRFQGKEYTGEEWKKLFPEEAAKRGY